MRRPTCVAALVAGIALSVNAWAAAAGTGDASYTTDQAYQGRFAYIENCAECHGGDLGGQFGPALSGPHSNVPWQTPQAVWSYMTQHMPVGNAEGLPVRDYLNIEAFLMQSSGRRAGKTKLTVSAIERDPNALDR